MKNQIGVGDQNTQQFCQNSVDSPKKLKFNYWVISVFVIVVILIFSGLFALYRNQKQNKSQLGSSLIIQPSPSIFANFQPSPLISETSQPSPSIPAPQLQIFPVKVYGSQMNDNVIDAKGGPAPCQPDFFDPKVSNFIKVKQDGTPSELYKIQGFQDDIEGGTMMIDGWYKEGEKKLSFLHHLT